MEITLHGNAELIVRQLVERGEFPSPDSAVNSLIIQTVSSHSSSNLENRRLPDPPLSCDEAIQIPNFPRHDGLPIVNLQFGERRVPTFLDIE